MHRASQNYLIQHTQQPNIILLPAIVYEITPEFRKHIHSSAIFNHRPYIKRVSNGNPYYWRSQCKQRWRAWRENIASAFSYWRSRFLWRDGKTQITARGTARKAHAEIVYTRTAFCRWFEWWKPIRTTWHCSSKQRRAPSISVSESIQRIHAGGRCINVEQTFSLATAFFR